MDMEKIGKFLAKLRKEQNETQEKLGETIGVSNKTISRWENGNYLPPVEMLQLLSTHYGVSINEILCGERLTEEQYKEKAESNLKSVLMDRTFTLEDRIQYFKKKWQREHMAWYVFTIALCLVILLVGIIRYQGLIIVSCMLPFILGLISYNRMMSYIEKNAYDGKGK